MGGMHIQVTPEQLASVSSQLNNGAATIEQTLQQLKSQVAPLQDAWKGMAQQRFMELYTQWETSSQKLQESLHGIAQMTNQASQTYESSEQQIAGYFSQ